MTVNSENLENAIVSAVRTGVEDRDIAVAFSGGLDSGLVAAIAKDSSPEVRVAEQQGVAEQFTVVVDQSFSLDYHDVFKRVSDGSIFRVTSRTPDSTAHPASTVKIARVTAERWVLPGS